MSLFFAMPSKVSEKEWERIFGKSKEKSQPDWVTILLHPLRRKSK